MVVGVRALEWTVFRLARDGWTPVDSGRCEPDLGDHPSLVAWLRAKPEQAGQLRAAGLHAHGPVTLVIPSSSALLRIVELPSADPAELEGMVDIQVDKLSPFPADNTLASHDTLQVGSQSSRVLIAATQKAIVEEVGQAFQKTGIRPHRVDVAILGWWHMLAKQGAPGATGRRVFVVASDDGCDILIADAGSPILFRALAPAPGMSVSEFAADVASELASTLTAIQIDFGDVALSSISLWRAESACPGLAQALRGLGEWTVSEEPLSTLGRLADGIGQRESLRQPGAILDLSLPAWHEAERTRLFRRRLATATAGVALLWLLVILGFFTGFEIESHRLATLESQLAAIQGTAEQVRATKNRVQRLGLHTDIRHSALECLRETALLLPDGIDLGSFIYRKGRAINIQGEAAMVGPIYEFKQNLDASALFSGTDLQGPVKVRGRETFRMVIRLPEGTP